MNRYELPPIVTATGPAPGFRPNHDGHPYRLVVAAVQDGTSIRGGIRPDRTYNHRADALADGRALVDRIRPLFDWMAHP